LKYLPLLIFFIFVDPIWSYDSKSIVSEILSNFADDFVLEVEAENIHSTIAVTEFIYRDKDVSQSNIGFAVSDMMRSRFSKSKNILVVEQEQVTKLIENMQAGLSGFYDEKTVASVGYLVGAEYMLIGSIVQIADYYRITARLVEIESGITILSKDLEIKSELLDRVSRKYISPNYRVRLGPCYSYYPQFGNWMKVQRYNLGISGGFYYNYSGNHIISASIDYYFYNKNYWIRKDISNGFYNISIDLRTLIDFSIGYGYNFQLTRYLTLTLNGHAGYNFLNYIYRGERMEDVYVDSSWEYDFGSRTIWLNHHSFFLMPSFDLILNSESNIALFINVGWKSNFNDINLIWPHSNPDIYVNETIQLSGFTSKMGLQMYF
jgi:TolB-like protein